MGFGVLEEFQDIIAVDDTRLKVKLLQKASHCG